MNVRMVSRVGLDTIRSLGAVTTCILMGVLVVQAAIAQTTDDDLLAPLPDASDEINPEAIDPEEAELEETESEEGEVPSLPPTPLEQPAPTLRVPSSDSFNSFNTGTANYLLGPGDQIGIAVIGFPEFESTRVILPDGTIALPLIGSVDAADRTVESLRDEITRRLSFYLVEPVVELNLSVLRPVVVTVAGEVYRPGPVQLSSLTTVNTRVGDNAQLSSASTAPTLSTALVSAGGVRRSADLRDIVVQRQRPNNREETVSINLWQSIFEGVEGNDILLQDGDIIFVPEAAEISDIDPLVVARSSLSPNLVRVRVIGEVIRPGEVQVSPESVVSDALAVAGGHNDDANLSQVALVRLQDNGQVEAQEINLSSFTDGTPIQEGDVIVVPKKGYLDFFDAVSRAIQPITSPFNFFLLLERIFD
ncbi:MAG: polysaccharide biosynthesis/export family protein [Leptolyngbyaceae cyanobacterium]